MAAQELPETLAKFTIGAAVVIRESHGALLSGTVTKRTKTQITTTTPGRPPRRWIYGWSGTLIPYGASGDNFHRAELILADDKRVPRMRAVRARAKADMELKVAARKVAAGQYTIEDVEALQALLPGWLDVARASRRASYLP